MSISLKDLISLNSFRILQQFAADALIINETQHEFSRLKGVFLFRIPARFS